MIACVYRSLSPTWDEAHHVASGLSWLEPPHRMLDPNNPPVGRITLGIGPWLFGVKANDSADSVYAGNEILRESGHYHRTITLGRLGVLPWYLLLIYLSWSITRRWLGEWPAALAAELIIFCPPVLAHASLATSDVAFAATFLFAIDRIWIALRDPGWRNYAYAGLAAGIDCATKLSGVPFTFLCTIVLVVWLWYVERKIPRLRHVAFALALMVLTIWASYRFQVGPLASTPNSDAQIARLAVKAGPLRPMVTAAANHVPAYQFFQGINEVRLVSKNWHINYLFGRTYSHGEPYFFLLMLLTKTPIPQLILGFAGLWLAMRELFPRSDSFAIVPVVGFIMPLLMATTSHLHLGIRYVLVIYPFLAMLGAFATERFLAGPIRSPHNPDHDSEAAPGWAKIGALGFLVAWSVVATVMSTPDFISWYNLPSAPWAAYIHVDSDFDWGQDLWRLSEELRTMKVDHVLLSYYGSVDLDQFHLPPWQPLPPGVPEKGWIAISETNFRMHPDAFGWLAAYKPVAVAGKTIRIYHIQ
jgi:hypothetical protein